jgi:hypothetical protein
MKRQEEQWYNDVPKYLSITLSICLSIYTYIHLFLFCLSVILSEKDPVFLSRPHRADWETPSNVAGGGGPISS